MMEALTIRRWILLCGMLQVVVLNAMMAIPISTIFVLLVAMALVVVGAVLNSFDAVRIHGLISTGLFCISFADIVVISVSERHFLAAIRKHGHHLFLSAVMMVLQAAAALGCLFVAAQASGFSLLEVARSRAQRRSKMKSRGKH